LGSTRQLHRIIRFRFPVRSRFISGVIESDDALAALLPHVAAADSIALDTEADSLHAYPEKLCLLQLGMPGADVLIDSLAGLDLKPLLDLLGKHELILHGADYDLRLLRRTFGFVPQAVFDTMLAARLLGYPEFGLTHLVLRLLGVKLEKGPQTADWARRPLTDRMARYALNDIHYLKPLSDSLRQQLADKGRVAWHKEVCARLVEDCANLQPIDPNQIWRLKGADKLSRRALAVLRELWNWRDQEAIAANKPPYFIMKHETLVALAQAAAHHRPLDPFLPSRRRQALIETIERALTIPPSEWPEINRPSGRRPTPTEKHLLEELRRRRDRRATELGIDPTLIASRATLGALAQDWTGHQSRLMDWQRTLLEK
jgi:ribonuclease D